MGPGRRTTRSFNAQPQPQPQSMPSSQSADASLGVMESGGRTASSSTLPQSRPNVSVGSSSWSWSLKLSTKNKANRGQKKVNHRGGSRSFLNHRKRDKAEEYERQAQELTTRLHENEGRVEELQNWKTASEAKLEFLIAHWGPFFTCHKLWQLHFAPRGDACEAVSGLGRSSLIRIPLRGLSLLPDLERYYESSVPDSIAAAIWFTDRTRSSYWLIRPDSIHESLVQLSLGAVVEVPCMVPVLSFSSPAENRRLPLGVACGSDCDGQYMSVITEHRPSSKVSSGLDALCSNQVPSGADKIPVL
ncbi:hypothetical protein IFM89_036561 [Coptis chinensis]|uniref:Uncharacterized protein n=1 Tax=Coptis chinensis TaxID=261450 RepID=A0A835HLU5_9MAGN|nr:hypothetical protein IFM89_036561 [Coptis chinensis]